MTPLHDDTLDRDRYPEAVRRAADRVVRFHADGAPVAGRSYGFDLEGNLRPVVVANWTFECPDLRRVSGATPWEAVAAVALRAYRERRG